MEYTETNEPLTSWSANWIWAAGHRSDSNFYMYARKEIDAPEFRSARVFVTCSTKYKLFINGRYVGTGPSPCHPAFQYFNSYELGQFLRPGKNVIAAICYNLGIDSQIGPAQPGGFLLQAEIENGDEPVVVATDSSWRVKPADDWDFNSAQLAAKKAVSGWVPGEGFQEVYDSRRKPVGWNVVGFDDSTCGIGRM